MNILKTSLFLIVFVASSIGSRALTGIKVTSEDTMPRTNIEPLGFFDRPTKEWQVNQIINGNTVIASRLGQLNVLIDLCGIDAPNVINYFEKNSKDNLYKLLYLVNGKVKIKNLEKIDDYRFKAEIYINVNGKEIFLNKKQVSDGVAYYLDHKSNNCNNRNFKETEAIAREKKVGIWGVANPGPLAKP